MCLDWFLQFHPAHKIYTLMVCMLRNLYVAHCLLFTSWWCGYFSIYRQGNWRPQVKQLAWDAWSVNDVDALLPSDLIFLGTQESKRQEKEEMRGFRRGKEAELNIFSAKRMGSSSEWGVKSLWASCCVSGGSWLDRPDLSCGSVLAICELVSWSLSSVLLSEIKLVPLHRYAEDTDSSA